jgi:hypothetical protein
MTMGLLARLPTVLLETVLAYLDHDDLHVVERTNRALAATLASACTPDPLTWGGKPHHLFD